MYDGLTTVICILGAVGMFCLILANCEPYTDYTPSEVKPPPEFQPSNKGPYRS